MKPFKDRKEAGRELAGQLSGLAGRKDVLIVAIARGGVEVGHELSNTLGLPMQVLVASKLVTRGPGGLTLGAVAEGGICILNQPILEQLPDGEKVLRQVREREVLEIAQRRALYRHGEPLAVRGRTVVLVDDGAITGSTAWGALACIQRLQPARVVLALPVAPQPVVERLGESVSQVVCLRTAATLECLEDWYLRYPLFTDRDVLETLAQCRKAHALPQAAGTLKLLVPVDGTVPCKEVARQIAMLAQGHAGTVILLRVSDAAEQPQAEAQLSQLALAARAGLGTDCTVTVKRETGDPLECILRCAQDEQADSILMATAKPGQLVNTLLREAPCQVQVILVSTPAAVQANGGQEAVRRMERAWNRQHVMWLEEVELWKEDSRRAQDALVSLEEGLIQKESRRMEEHLKTIVAQEQQFARHSHQLDKGASGGPTPEELERLAAQHAEQETLHENLRQVHMQLLHHVQSLVSLSR